jgi:hypothetical protein
MPDERDRGATILPRPRGRREGGDILHSKPSDVLGVCLTLELTCRG